MFKKSFHTKYFIANIYKLMRLETFFEHPVYHFKFTTTNQFISQIQIRNQFGKSKKSTFLSQQPNTLQPCLSFGTAKRQIWSPNQDRRCSIRGTQPSADLSSTPASNWNSKMRFKQPHRNNIWMNKNCYYTKDLLLYEIPKAIRDWELRVASTHSRVASSGVP